MEEIEQKRRGRPPMVRAEVSEVAAPVSTVQVRVLRDFWTDEGRVRAGTVISVPVQDALKGVKTGALDPIED